MRNRLTLNRLFVHSEADQLRQIESFPTSIRATGGAIIHAMGPIGAVVAGFGATQVLSAGSDWQTAALWFGALPCFLSGALMFAARHVRPETVQ